MRSFVLLTDAERRGISDEMLRTYDALPRRRGWSHAWERLAQAAVLTAWDDPWGAPLVARSGDIVAVGMVRLDNRPDVELLTGLDHTDCRALSDLDVVMRVVALRGTACVRGLLGDFAFVVWDGQRGRAIAAVDAFAVRRLYHAERQGLVAFSSRAELLALDGRYEVRYFAELVATHEAPEDITAYEGVSPIPAAATALLERGALRLDRYWHARDHAIEDGWERTEQDVVHHCRTLLSDAVRVRLGTAGETMAQLSGGLDSSSVVSVAQSLEERGDVPAGIASTVTFVDRQGTGTDERRYSDAVVRRWRVPNEQIIDAPTWYDERYAPPITDQPGLYLQCYPRECRLLAIARAQGRRILLTGAGGDQLFMGSMLFFADRVARGDLWGTARQMARTAALGRVSFWTLAYRSVVLPLLPRSLQRHLIHDENDGPREPWLNERTLRRHGIVRRSASAPEYEGRFGRKYQDAITTRISTLPLLTRAGIVHDGLDVRHPLLHRPLVEFALRLPPALRARPHQQRWILREALRGILPEEVRTRVGKQDTGDVLAWSLAAARDRLAPLASAPLLSEMGVVDGHRLQMAFASAGGSTSRRDSLHGALCTVLAVEGWLAVRSGGWPCGGHQSSTEGPS